MHKKLSLIVLLLISFACQQKPKEKKFEQVQADEDYLITISTNYGDMKAILYEQTPFHRKNFLKLAYQGFYDGLLFHRVIQNFMIQGGDPQSRYATAETQLGQGSNGYTIPAEFRKELFHEKGALAAARLPDQLNPHKASNGCQFYIVQGTTFNEEQLQKANTDTEQLNQLFVELLKKEQYQGIRELYVKLQNENRTQDMLEVIWKTKAIIEKEFGVELDLPMSDAQKNAYLQQGGAPSLDGEYTVFGKIIDGWEVLDKIAQTPTQNERPLEDIKMQVSAQIVKKATLTQKYGIQYNSK